MLSTSDLQAIANNIRNYLDKKEKNQIRLNKNDKNLELILKNVESKNFVEANRLMRKYGCAL